MARPRGSTKPETERYITRSFRFPPDLWERFEQRVPDRERSRFLRSLLEDALEVAERPAVSVTPGSAADRLEQLAIGADGRVQVNTILWERAAREAADHFSVDEETRNWLDLPDDGAEESEEWIDSP